MSVKFKSMRIALTLTFLLIVGSLSAQTVQVNVKDATGEAVIGASVIEQGTQNGGVTDFDGNFTIKLTSRKANRYLIHWYEDPDNQCQRQIFP